MKNKLTILLVFLSSLSFGQFGNEWIDYSAPHYSFQITEDGIYHISYEVLENTFPISSINLDDLKIYGKQRQVPIYIELGSDLLFNAGDYIEFYAEGNDGWLDSSLYETPNEIGNPEYSLYNDTINYFLTYNQEPSLRYELETDQNTSIYTPSNFILKEIKQSLNNAYHVGYSLYSSYRSAFENGEGWGSSSANGGGNTNGFTFNFSANTPDVYTGTDAPLVYFQGKSNAVSDAAYTGTGNHHLSWTIGSNSYTLYDEIFTGYRSTNATHLFPSNLLSNGNNALKFNIINDQGALTDFQAVNFWRLVYPQTPNLNNQQISVFEIINNPTENKIRLDLQNAALNNPSILVTGSQTPRKLLGNSTGNTLSLLIPNTTSGSNQKVMIYAENQINQIDTLNPINGTGYFVNYSLLSAENAFIIVYNNKLATGAAAYANYRGSAGGGSHNVILSEIAELSNQFGGGIDKHALSIRRFVDFMYTSATEKPIGLLLLGKGVREATEPNSSSGLGSRKSSSAYALNLVPSYGYPSSDLALTAELNGSNSWAPLIPTGRIAAKNNEELLSYLDKVIEYENEQNQSSMYTKPLKEWQKQVLHFGGGSNSSEQNLFKAYLNGMKQSIEGPDYGGNVTSFFKETSDPINPVALTEVNGYIENGVSLMTFFGHATIDGFDQNVDDPVNWNNKGKYPMVVGNACYTGDIFQAQNTSTSENFVLTPEAGSIAFLSSVKLGFASYLNIYTSELYKQFSPTSYAKSIGQQIINTIQSIEGNNSNFILETTCNQMTYHGDPILKLNWHAKPEIDLQIEDVYFTPQNISLSTDSIAVNIILTNLGKAITDTFGLDVVRNFSGSTIDSVYNIPVNGLPYKDTIILQLPLQPNIGVGINNFSIAADIPSFITENYEEVNNNQLKKQFFININGILPAVPYNYAVVPNDTLTLKASTINPIADFNTYRFEIDTTDLFNSPEHRHALISGYGGVKEVPFNAWINSNSNNSDPLILEDSTAYFWRVAVDSSQPQYTESSFQYIKNKTGWGQDHFFQFKNGSFNGVSYNRQTRQRQFAPQPTRYLSTNTFDHANNFYAYNYTRWSIDGNYVEYGMCTTSPSLHLVVIDPITLEPWKTHDASGQNTEGHNLGQVNYYNESTGSGTCRGRAEYYFIYRQDAAGLAALDNAINNLIPDGYYYMIYTASHATYSTWDANYPQLFNTFQNVCYSDSIYSGQNEMAFIYIGQMGNSSFVYETTAITLFEEIYLEAPITGADFYGTERSTLIGPSANWNTLYWKQDTENPVPGLDSTFLKIIPFSASGNQGPIIDTLFTSNDSIQNLNDLVDAQLFPYLS
ncbi:MAG: C25 family cysteine peptidase [Lishizhenia sp.]